MYLFNRVFCPNKILLVELTWINHYGKDFRKDLVLKNTYK